MTRRESRVVDLFFLIAYLRQNQGAHVKDVAKRLGVSPRELRALIEQLSLCGKHPFGPGDLVDVWFERDRIYLELDQHLGQPPKFTRDEALALSIALGSLASSESNPLSAPARTALQKLRARVAEDADPDVRSVEHRITVENADDDGVERFARLKTAFEERREVEIVYYTQSRDALRTRRLRTYALVQNQGAWYAVGHDSASKTVRVFKVDRIKDVQITEVRYRIPASFRPERYRRDRLFVGSRAHEARVRFRPGLSAVVQEEWEAARVEEEPDGSVVAHISYTRLDGLASALSMFPEGVEVLGPPELRERIRARAAAALELYRPPRDPAPRPPEPG